MIVCHEKELIFIKATKVAGTSFEIALSKYCGDDCVITPVSETDEALRQSLGFRRAQNFENTYWKAADSYSKTSFYNHMPAAAVRNAMPRKIWNGYKKISIYRNPFDVAISRYFWKMRQGVTESFLDYVIANRPSIGKNNRIAPLKGPAKLDAYIRYEFMQDDLEALGLGYLWDDLKDIRAKGKSRPDKGAGVEEMYRRFPEAIDIIAEECAEDIACFEYPLPQV